MHKIGLFIVFMAVVASAFGLGVWCGSAKPVAPPNDMVESSQQERLTLNSMSSDNDAPQCPQTLDSNKPSSDPASELHCETSWAEKKKVFEQHIASLQNKIEKQDQQIDFTNQRFNGAVQALKKANLPLPDAISLEDARKLVPPPFDQVIASGNPNITEKFNRLQSLPIDYEWGIIMQQRISDHFTTHEFGHLVTLDSVSCRQDICEIRGFEQQQDTWNSIMQSMVATPWWNATGTNSVSGSGSDYGAYFYVIASFPQSD